MDENLNNDDNIVKIDLTKPPKSEEQVESKEETSYAEQEPVENDAADETGVVGSDENTEPAPEQEKVQAESETQEFAALEEVTEEEAEEEAQEVVEEIKEAIAEAEETGEPLPENIQKLVDFMSETGGTLEDYVNLNKDYSELDNLTALTEYYKKTKPHLTVEEINFLIEDSFSYDEEIDESIDIKRKKLALKEQVASAKAYLDGQKSKYYDEIKAGSRLTLEQQKALDFFNRYTKESEEANKTAKKTQSIFIDKTNQVFNDRFKGFEYSVGDKKYRFNVRNAPQVKETQSDITNFVKKFLNEDGTMKDAKGYHKSLYTAMNADAIAQHFYEQGKTDALKQSVAKSKNISMEPRQGLGEVKVGGTKFKVLSGKSSNDFKVKLKKSK
jgi:hypothetical protein